MSSSTSQVMEYDPFSQEFQADPFPVYRWMRDQAPVFYSEKWNWWALSRFEDVRAAATDPPGPARSGSSWTCKTARGSRYALDHGH